jgi:3-oxoacyl-[acyl-carrier-protein] synthase II
LEGDQRVLKVAIISGVGLMTPLGSDVEQTWDALLAGRFITDHARAKIDSRAPDRINALAHGAAREALAQARWSERRSAAGGTALVIGTSKGAVESWMTPLPDMSDSTYVLAGGSELSDPRAYGAPEYGLASIAARLRGMFKLLDGPALTFSAACASGLHALIRGALMIQCGEADRVLVVAAEASVHPMFLASFKRLGVLPREGAGCRPFDVDRDGFLMSEAAAAVCLESAEAAGSAVQPQFPAGESRVDPDQTTRLRFASRPPVRIAIDRFALGGDATHLTGGDAQARVLRRMIHQAMDRRPVDLIHAHGTGTVLHDPVELAAFEDECVFDASPAPMVYSHKGALGHSLGAAGLVSVVLNCVIHARGVMPGNVQTRRALPTKRVAIPHASRRQTVGRSLAAASGFGGAVAAVTLISL